MIDMLFFLFTEIAKQKHLNNQPTQGLPRRKTIVKDVKWQGDVHPEIKYPNLVYAKSPFFRVGERKDSD